MNVSVGWSVLVFDGECSCLVMNVGVCRRISVFVKVGELMENAGI